MNALIKKEIRLLLPGWAAVLLLETALPWFGKDADAIFGWMPAAFFFGMVILAVDVFGREFNLGIFQSLMAQPIERQRIWRTKIGLLGLAAGLIFLSYAASCGLRVSAAVSAEDSVWRVNPGIIWQDYRHACGGSILLLWVAASGGLWTALLLRQTAAAFWVTFLTPLAILTLALLLLESKFAGNERFAINLMIGLSVAYSGAGFWLARRLFFHAQDVAWTGGVVSFSRWRYFERKVQITNAVRRHRPWMALWKKEFQLHSLSLFCAGGLLALHLVMFFLRAFYSNFHRDSFVFLLSEFFWSFWLVMPIVLGCVAVAEERKLGVVDEQFCLPISRRRLFAFKFLPVLLVAVFLGAVMPLVLETLALRVGVPGALFKALLLGNDSGFSGGPAVVVAMVALAMGLAWISFYGSTITRNFLQALSLAIAGSVLLLVLFGTIKNYLEHTAYLPIIIAVPVLPSVLIWLAWRNFSQFHDDWRLWLRNLSSIVAALVFVAVSSLAVYNRVWEVFLPAEPSHGIPKMTSETAPKLSVYSLENLLVRWPTGRVWYDVLGYDRLRIKSARHWRFLWATLTHPLPESDGPRRFVAGSNWVSFAIRRVNFSLGDLRFTGFGDGVGVKSDGSLWISSEAKPGVWTAGNMAQVGAEMDWKKVIPLQMGFALLKTNGTLWQWTNQVSWNAEALEHWPTVRNHPLQQIGTERDWVELAGGRWGGRDFFARKADGTVWAGLLLFPQLSVQFDRRKNLDSVTLESISENGTGQFAYVDHNGVLYRGQDSHFSPVGSESNWVSVVFSGSDLVALKSDGRLWHCEPGGAVASMPKRLGIHNDWVGLAQVWENPVSLSADGGLWVWPQLHQYGPALTKPPKQPKYVGSVFGSAN